MSEPIKNNDEKRTCGKCGSKISYYNRNDGYFRFMCDNNCFVMDIFVNSEAEAVSAFNLATRAGLDKLRAGDAITCQEEDCCGCLVEGMIQGQIHCNECGKRYNIAPEKS